jgi:translation initiation factor SUI1
MDRLLDFNTSTTTAINSLFTAAAAPSSSSTPANRTGKIHIRPQQQGKRWVTTIEGLDDDLDQERIARAMKKAFHCASKVIKTDEGTEVIMLQGKYREEALEWLLQYEVLSDKEGKERVVLHGV